MPKIKVKSVDQISRKPVSYAHAAFMRHCQLKNLSPYSYLYYNKNIKLTDMIPKAAVISDSIISDVNQRQKFRVIPQ